MKYSDFIKEKRPCPFCERGDKVLAENDTAYITFALAPYHPDHLLVVPKRHTEHLLDITEKEMGDIDILEKKGLDILSKLGYLDMSILVREGDGTGKSVSHVHYHIIPNIRLGNSDHTGAEREVLSAEQLEILKKRIMPFV